VEFLDAVAEGNKLTWTQVVTTPMKLTLKFDVDVDGDAMTGTSKAGSFQPPRCSEAARHQAERVTVV